MLTESQNKNLSILNENEIVVNPRSEIKLVGATDKAYTNVGGFLIGLDLATKEDRSVIWERVTHEEDIND